MSPTIVRMKIASSQISTVWLTLVPPSASRPRAGERLHLGERLPREFLAAPPQGRPGRRNRPNPTPAPRRPRRPAAGIHSSSATPSHIDARRPPGARACARPSRQPRTDASAAAVRPTPAAGSPGRSPSPPCRARSGAHAPAGGARGGGSRARAATISRTDADSQREQRCPPPSTIRNAAAHAAGSVVGSVEAKVLQRIGRCATDGIVAPRSPASAQIGRQRRAQVQLARPTPGA